MLSNLLLVVCQYQQNCTGPNENGLSYVPSERDCDNVITTGTLGDFLYIFLIPNLDADCSGQVTAIEYCYRYSRFAESGEASFNWTVLILEDGLGNNFVINSTYAIFSRPSEGSANCTTGGDLQTVCCDVTVIEGFELPMDFVFGVTESPQGNTHSAVLLGFSDMVPQYGVDSIVIDKDGLSLSVGSSIPSGPEFERGLRMLWFAVGKHSVINFISIIIVAMPV